MTDEQLEFYLFSLMIYSEGGLSWSELQEMPLPQVRNLIEYADRINKMKQDRAEEEIRKSKR